VTKPGGFIEIVEFISPKNSGPVITKMYKTRKQNFSSKIFFLMFLTIIYRVYFIIDSEISLQRGVDMSLIPKLDSLIELHQNITKVHRDERSFIVGPNGGSAGMVILDIMTRFNTSESAIEEITHNQGVSSEELLNAFVTELGKELKETKPELTLCRFWAQKDT
jgi:hypothetical protein